MCDCACLSSSAVAADSVSYALYMRSHRTPCSRTLVTLEHQNWVNVISIRAEIENTHTHTQTFWPARSPAAFRLIEEHIEYRESFVDRSMLLLLLLLCPRRLDAAAELFAGLAVRQRARRRCRCRRRGLADISAARLHVRLVAISRLHGPIGLAKEPYDVAHGGGRVTHVRGSMLKCGCIR